MRQLKELETVLRDCIKPVTSPIAVRLSKNEEIPAACKHPADKFGYAVALCQGFGLARRYGWSMAFDIHDMACGPSLSYFGFVEIPDFEKEGGLVHPMYAKTPEAGRRSENIIDKLPAGSVETILIAPLERVQFSPDLIVVYGNAAQMARLTQGALYCQGGGIETVVAGRCACTAAIIAPYKKGDYNLILPDGGERIFALTQDDEMAFTIPFAKVPDLIEGIVATHQSGVARYPYPVYGLRGEPKFPERYQEIVNLARKK